MTNTTPETVTLWKWADLHEGEVETDSWGACVSETCAHASHDPYFEFRITKILAFPLWEGEYGERVVKSAETGRVFYTRYYPDGHYAPWMSTSELTTQGDKFLVPRDIWERLLKRYGSPRHKCLKALIKAGGVIDPPQDE